MKAVAPQAMQAAQSAGQAVGAGAAGSSAVGEPRHGVSNSGHILQRGYLMGQPLRQGIDGYIQVIAALQVQPVLRTLSEIQRQPQGHLRRDRTPPIDDMTDAHGGYPQRLGQLGLAHAQFIEQFLQVHARMHRRNAILGHHQTSSMVIHDLNIQCVALLPDKANPPLGINTEAPLPRALAF